MAESDDEQDSETSTAGPICSDPKSDIFDCPICFEPLKAPIFQCFNGHVACSSCCSNTLLNKSCPACSEEIGSIRNRFVENILETLKFRCVYQEYGCKETLSYYDMKKVHAKTCKYVPCSCPCCDDFVDSFSNLYIHFSDQHSDSAVQFTYDELISVTLNNKVQNEVFFMQTDYRGDAIFVLNNVVIDPSVGNGVYIVCIGPDCMNGMFSYVVCVGNGREMSLRFEDCVKSVKTKCDAVAENFGSIAVSTNYFVIPSSFFDSDGKLKLDIKIIEVPDP